MSKLITLDSLKNLDYEKLGLICGLEIHQQLDTGKLFCTCPSNILPNKDMDKKIERKLRFSLSETGEIDKAALSEFKKGKTFEYIYNDKCACLVDLDEEPPKGPNPKALQTVLKVSKMLNLKLFDKIQFMRKLIINGSVVSGYQRTAMLGFGGHLETKAGTISIDGVNLEEDASKIVEKHGNKTVFALDRQGIPLIEITTGPNLHNPEEAQAAALQIGNILRSFNETKRGIGTIRQDLNVSISGGTRIEIKGAQNLKLIPEVIKGEIRRQKILLSIKDLLKQRKVNADNFSDYEIYDLTTLLKNTESKVLKSNLEEKGSKILALKLFGFKGILGHEIQENYRFATEISDRVKQQFHQIKGLFHSDELPKYGITQEEVDKIHKHLKNKKEDSFILIAQKKEIAESALKTIVEILPDFILGVPSEVRQVDPKGTLTKHLRPMPGSARMYPETDIPEIEINKKEIEKLKLPELYDNKIERLKKELNLEEAKILEILSKYDETSIKKLLNVSTKSASALYSIIFELPKDIKKRDNLEPIDFKETLLEDLLKISTENNLTQKTIRDIFVSLYKDKLCEISNLKNYIEEKGLLGDEIDSKEIETKLKEIVEKNKGAPFGALMGHAMKAFGGKVDGKAISQILKKLM
ncbi:MAG: Glu-tRNA(Gln) amidotransferase subunit GatE [Nanoarchaeota archaeon]